MYKVVYLTQDRKRNDRIAHPAFCTLQDMLLKWRYRNLDSMGTALNLANLMITQYKDDNKLYDRLEEHKLLEEWKRTCEEGMGSEAPRDEPRAEEPWQTQNPRSKRNQESHSRSSDSSNYSSSSGSSSQKKRQRRRGSTEKKPAPYYRQSNFDVKPSQQTTKSPPTTQARSDRLGTKRKRSRSRSKRSPKTQTRQQEEQV
jgi:hypothetical protein